MATPAPPSSYADVALRLPLHLAVWDDDADRLARLLLLASSSSASPTAAGAAGLTRRNK